MLLRMIARSKGEVTAFAIGLIERPAPPIIPNLSLLQHDTVEQCISHPRISH